MESNAFTSSDPTNFTYAEVGATAFLPLPDGYHHLAYRTELGPVSFAAAADAIETFAMHRVAGIGMLTDASRAFPGARVTVRLGVGPVRVLAPCAIVAVFDDPDRRGFSYGTLAGHPERGEEAFFVTRDRSGAVTFEVRAFSRSGRWFTTLATPVVPAFQQLYARHLARALRRILRGRN